MVNTSNTGPDPGDTNTSPAAQTPLQEVFGTPGTGKVPSWNAATNRFEWTDPHGTYAPWLRSVAATPLGTVYAPSDLHMKVVSRQRSIRGGFNLFRAQFADGTNYNPGGFGGEQLKIVNISGTGTVQSGGGKWAFTWASGTWAFQGAARVRLAAPVAEAVTTIGQINHTPQLGWGKSASDNVLFYYHGTDTTFHIQQTVSGSVTRDLIVKKQTLATGDQIKMVLNYPTIGLWWRPAVLQTSGSADWQWIAEVDISGSWNLQTVSELKQWYAFIGESISGGTGSFLGFEVNIPAGYGMRDPTLCTFADGTPFVRDGKYYIAYTEPCTGLSYQGNHMAVATFDPVSYQVEQVAVLFFRTDSTHSTNNYAGHWIYDEAADVFRVIMCNWGVSGSPPTPMWLATTDRDLTKGVHCISATQLTLPGSSNNVEYDPQLRKSGNTWMLLGCYDDGTGAKYPAVWTSTDLTTWTQAHTNTAHQAEGGKWAKIGGTWYAVFGGLASGTIFDFLCFAEDLTYVGELTTWSAGFDTLPGYQSTANDTAVAPHPCLIPVADDDRTRYVLVTFDRTQFVSPGRADAACGTTSGSATVTDTSAMYGDVGRAVTGSGIPANSYVGTVSPGASFTLSSSATSNVPVNATATASVTVTFGAIDGGKASTGACVVMEADEQTTGHEFDRRHVLRAG